MGRPASELVSTSVRVGSLQSRTSGQVNEWQCVVFPRKAREDPEQHLPASKSDTKNAVRHSIGKHLSFFVYSVSLLLMSLLSRRRASTGTLPEHNNRTTNPRRSLRRPTQQVSERIIVNDCGISSRICEDLRKSMSSKTNELVVHRTNLDALLAGSLKDILESRLDWQLVELLEGPSPSSSSATTSTSSTKHNTNTNRRWVQRLLQVLSKRQSIHQLILKDPSEASLKCVASWFQHSLSWLDPADRWARVDEFVIKLGAVSETMALILQQGLVASNQQLTHLELSNSSFSSFEAVEAVSIGLKGCHRSLQKLSLTNCHLEDYEIAVLVEALLQPVSSESSTDNVTSDPQLLHAFPNLRELNFSVNFCQEAGTLALARLLTVPNSSPPTISPDAESSSSQQASEPTTIPPPIQALDLSCQDVWDDREYFIHLASALATNNCLVELNLGSNFFDDDQFIWLVLGLRQNSCLRQLHLRDNRITNVGMQTFAKTLPELRTLEQIDLTRNRYSAQGVLTLLGPLCHANTQLKKMDLDWDEKGCDRHEGGKYLLLHYYLALNRAGRYCKLNCSLDDRPVPPGLWPHILERGPLRLRVEDEMMGIERSDILYDSLRGPALLDR